MGLAAMTIDSTPTCAWCLHRSGDLCTNPESSVNRRFFLRYQRGWAARLAENSFTN